jgi:hypothetical protein
MDRSHNTYWCLTVPKISSGSDGTGREFNPSRPSIITVKDLEFNFRAEVDRLRKIEKVGAQMEYTDDQTVGNFS